MPVDMSCFSLLFLYNQFLVDPYDLSITIFKDFSTCTGAIDCPSASEVILKMMAKIYCGPVKKLEWREMVMELKIRMISLTSIHTIT